MSPPRDGNRQRPTCVLDARKLGALEAGQPRDEVSCVVRRFALV
jgi:hypothetical protein